MSERLTVLLGGYFFPLMFLLGGPEYPWMLAFGL